MVNPIACWCMALGRDECLCEIPWIGNQAEADRRVKDGSLEALWDETHTQFIVPREAIRVALMADFDAKDPRLIRPAPMTHQGTL